MPRACVGYQKGSLRPAACLRQLPFKATDARIPTRKARRGSSAGFAN
jgi:hypothetical protein